MGRLRDSHLVRDVVVSLLASALFVPIPALLSSRFGQPALFAGLVVALFFVCLVVLRATVAQRRIRSLIARYVGEPSVSRAGDLFVDLVGEMARRGRLEPEALADLAQRRRHPASRLLDGIDVVRRDDSNGIDPVALGRHLRAVREAKSAARGRAASRAAEHLQQLLDERSVLLLYGFSTIVCDAVGIADPPVPVFIVRDAQYGTQSSLGEHAMVRDHLAAHGVESLLIHNDQIASLLDPAAHRLKVESNASVPLPDPRRVVAVIGCEAADCAGRVLIPATVRSQPSETAWFVAEFVRARQRGQGASIGAELVVVGESYKVFDDIGARPELRTTAAPIAVGRRQRVLHSLTGMELPRGTPVQLIEIGPEVVDAYVDDVVAVKTRRGSLQLDASHHAWNERVGLAGASVGATAADVSTLFADAEVVFFDFNGVLVDDEVDHYCAFTALARSTADRSLPIDVYLGACAGRTDREGVEELVRLGFVTGTTDELLEEKQRFYQAHAVPVSDTHRDRIRTVFDKLGVRPLVLVTSSDRESVVSALGEQELIDRYFTPDRALFEVPSSERVRAIDAVARRLGASENRRCVVVDDSTRNLAELRRRGYRTLGVSGLVSDRPMPADVVVNDLTELDDLLDHLPSTGR